MSGLLHFARGEPVDSTVDTVPKRSYDTTPAIDGLRRSMSTTLALSLLQAEDVGMSAVPEEIRKLPVEERLRLAEDIWESIRSDPEAVPLTETQRAELDRRLAAFRADPDAGDDLDTVVRWIRGTE